MKEFVMYPARSLLIVLLVLLIAIVGCSSGEKADEETTADTAKEQAAPAGEIVEKAAEGAEDIIASLANPEPGIDPVCKMEIDGSLVVEVDGKKYGFCSQHCADMFKENPAKYLAAAEESEEE